VTDTAVLYLVSRDDAAAAMRLVMARPVAFRVLMTAVRAGIARVGVPSTLRNTAVEAAIARTPSARRAVYWLDDGVPSPDCAVLIPAAAYVTRAGLNALREAPAPAVLAASRNGDALAIAVRGPVLRSLWPALASGEPVGDVVDRAVASGTFVDVPGEFIRICSSASLACAETALLGGVGSPIDTAVDRAFHRRLSLPITRIAITLGITPNAMTIASMAVGVAAAFTLAAGTPTSGIAAFVLYAAAVVLDHSDGEVARLTVAESRLGEWLDLSVDTVVHTAIVLGMAAASERVTGTGTIAGLVAAAGVIVTAWFVKTTVTGQDPVGIVFRVLGNRDGFYALLLLFVAALVYRPNALPAIVTLAAAGTHAYWVARLLYRLARRRQAPFGENTWRKPK
jgi:phosphatidylglycerophosphate synthase